MVQLEAYGSWEEALARLGESRKALLALLQGADPTWLTTPLREGAWTPLMVAEHIALVEASTARVLRRLRRMRAGEALPPVQAVPGEYKDGKPQAPEGVRPQGGWAWRRCWPSWPGRGPPSWRRRPRPTLTTPPPFPTPFSASSTPWAG